MATKKAFQILSMPDSRPAIASNRLIFPDLRTMAQDMLMISTLYQDDDLE